MTQNTEQKSHGRFIQMDLVRYFLSVAVVIAHFNIIFGTNLYWPMSSTVAVGAFFGLSGFLVYASYMRHHSTKDYLTSRARRILPAYWFIVITCAILLSTLSSLDITGYFYHHGFWKYLLANMLFLNFIQPNLPGVFADHSVNAVNGSLWTLKVEWMLYLSTPIFFLILKKSKVRFAIATAILFACSVAYYETMLYTYEVTGNRLYYILSYQFTGQLVFFYTGVACYHYRQKLLNNKMKFLILGILLVVADDMMLELTGKPMLVSCVHDLIFPIGIVITILVISVAKPVSENVIKLMGNCSYEMYLFHFPVLQCFACSETFRSLPHWMMLCICMMVIVALSFGFNKYIERIWK